MDGPEPKSSLVLKLKTALGEEYEADDDSVEEVEVGESYGGESGFKKKNVVFVCGFGKRGSGNSGGGGEGVSLPRCQAEKCTADLTCAKRYHRRHKVCESHAKASAVVVEGLRQRFCQQCSRFHELSEFDGAKRSCRKRLAGHNERRRKSSSESNGEGCSQERSDLQLKGIQAVDR